ncbi:MAG: hypothetical protein PUD20_08045 [bacterium]|nr:hypothetical protein [bacterium]
MSLKESGERLLAEALTEAMDRDLADIPPMEQLKKQHRFSKKFIRTMRRLGAHETGRWETLGVMAKRYSGLAAAFVCVIGLVTVAGFLGRFIQMGKSSANESIMKTPTADTALPEFVADHEMEESAEEAPEEMPQAAEPPEEMSEATASPDEDTGAGEQEVMPDSSQTETAMEESEAFAPDWQEELLLESAKADELVTWHLDMIYEDGSIGLTSKVVNPSHQEQAPAGQSLFVSGVFEVYYEESPGEWACIFRTKRTREDCSGVENWDEWYALEDLHMTQAGTYRLVRQVNSNRQVLQLTLDERG